MRHATRQRVKLILTLSKQNKGLANKMHEQHDARADFTYTQITISKIVERYVLCATLFVSAGNDTTRVVCCGVVRPGHRTCWAVAAGWSTETLRLVCVCIFFGREVTRGVSVSGLAGKIR